MPKLYLDDLKKTIEWDDPSTTPEQAAAYARSVYKPPEQNQGGADASPPVAPSPQPEPPKSSDDRAKAIVEALYPQRKQIVDSLKSQSPGTEDALKNVPQNWALKQGIGLVNGLSLPVVTPALNAAVSPLVDATTQALSPDNPTGVSPLDMIKEGYSWQGIKDNYNKFNEDKAEAKKEAPYSYGLGNAVKNMALFGMGSNLLAGAGPLAGPASLQEVQALGNLGSKAGAIAKLLTRSGLLNAGLGQQEGLDANRLPSDFVSGAEAELGSLGTQKLGQMVEPYLRKIGGGLIDRALNRPKNEIKKELQQGETLGQQLYDRNVWGSTNSLGNQAENAREQFGEKLQNFLESGAANGKELNQNTVMDSILNLKNDPEYVQNLGKLTGPDAIDAALEALKKDPEKFAPKNLAQANKVKSSLQEISNYVKESDPLGAAITKAQASGIRQGIEDAFVNEGSNPIRDINQELSIYKRLNEAVNNLKASNQKPSVIGNLIKGLGIAGAGGAAYGMGGGAGVAIPAAGAAYLASTPFGKTGMARALKLVPDTLSKTSNPAFKKFLADYVFKN